MSIYILRCWYNRLSGLSITFYNNIFYNKKSNRLIFTIYRVRRFLLKEGLSIFLNERLKSRELNYYEALSRRCELTKDETRKLSILRRGFEGEKEYDRIFDEAGHENILIYRDLWLKIEGSTLQIDALIITEDTLIVNEIKNYSGLYSYENNGWFINGTQISDDPLAQASRTGNKLLKLRYLLQQNFDRDYKVVFVNPNFNLNIKSDDERNIVQRSILRNYMKELNKLHAGQKAYEMSRGIRQYFIEDPMPLPELDYERVKNGNYCSDCGFYGLELKRYHAVCHQCSNRETIEKMIIRSMIDFVLLFKNTPMTKERLIQFIGGNRNERSIRRCLNKYGVKVGAGRSTEYIIETQDLISLLKNKNYNSRYEKDTALKRMQNL